MCDNVPRPYDVGSGKAHCLWCDGVLRVCDVDFKKAYCL